MRFHLIGYLSLFILSNVFPQEKDLKLLNQFRGHGKITTYDFEEEKLYLISGKILEIFKLSEENFFNKISEYAYPVDNNSLPTQIYVKDNFLYSNNGQKGLWILDISDMNSIKPRRDFFPSITKTAQGFEVFDDHIFFNQIIGYGSSSIIFAEILDPITIKEVGKYQLPFYSESFSYQVKNNYLYIVAQKYYEYNYLGADLIVVDISDFNNPTVVYQVHSSFRDLAINDKYLYVSDSVSVLKIFDISDKSNLKLANSINFEVNSNYNKSIDLKINNNKLLVSQHTQNGDRNCWLYNLSSANNPELIDSLILPYEINNGHKNISLENDKIFTSKDYGLEYYNIYEYKIQNQNRLEFAEEFTSKEVILENNLIYLLSDKGFYIVDIENPNDPFVRSKIIITGTSMFKKDNFIYLSGSPDLRIIDVSDVNNSFEIGYWDSYGFSYDVEVKDNQAFLAYSNGDWQNPVEGIKILDITDKENPTDVITIDLGIRANEIKIDSTFMYVTAGNSSSETLSGLYIFDITDPLNPNEISYIEELGGSSAIEVQDNNVFISTNKSLKIYDIQDKNNPRFRSFYDLGRQIGDIQFGENKLFLAGGVYGVVVLDISNIENPILNSIYDTHWITGDLSIDENLLVTAESTGGILIFSLNNSTVIDSIQPDNYKLEQNYPNPFNSGTVIQYSIPKEEHIKINVFDILGREVETLVDEMKQSGNYKVEFNASQLPSGVYFYQLIAGNYSQTRKMVFIK